MKKENVKKIIGITSTVVLYLFIAICLCGVLLTITAKKDKDGTATILGTQMRLVTTSSMEKSPATDVSGFKVKHIPVNSMVFIDVVPEDPAEAEKWYADLKVGDVLTFKYVYTRQITITHRITEIEKKATGGYLITLEGDNKGADGDIKTSTQTIDTSEPYSPNYIIGKVTGKSFILGWFISTLKKPVGIVVMIIIPAFVIIVFEVIKLFKLFGAEKKEQQDAETKKQQDEIEMLKKKLADLEAKEKAESEQPTPDVDPKDEGPEDKE